MNHFFDVSKKIKITVLGLLPALLVVILSVYLLNKGQKNSLPINLPGKPLAAYPNLYPVNVEDGTLHLDRDVFMDAVNFFSTQESPKAVADLIYLGQSNNVTLLLNKEEKIAYRKLLERPIFSDLKKINRHRDKMFEVYKDIVNGIGQTFSGTGSEIVLHDTRNPLRSVVAIQNPISGRRLGDSTTNFGIQLIKDFSIVENRSSSYVSYPLTLKDGRKIKSSTIPLFDDSYGLIGFICLNIDISKIEDQKIGNPDVAQFINNFVSVVSNQKIDEMIENSRISSSLEQSIN